MIRSFKYWTKNIEASKMSDNLKSVLNSLDFKWLIQEEHHLCQFSKVWASRFQIRTICKPNSSDHSKYGHFRISDPHRINKLTFWYNWVTPVRLFQVTWHAKGDYFATVCPDGANRAVLIHQLSKWRSQVPFSKAKGLVQCVLFHPVKPYLFVATQRHVRIYNLVSYIVLLIFRMAASLPILL